MECPNGQREPDAPLLCSSRFLLNDQSCYAAIIVFLLFAIASLIQGTKLVMTRGWRIYGVYCIVVGLIQAVFPIGTTVYFINPGIVGNVNSPGSGLFNRIALLIGPLTWYIILGCIVLVRSRAQKPER